jgi:uncharacterized membrane protein (GlpM family)
MIVKADLSGLKEMRWYEFAVRFIFGGLITAIAGVLAKEWGPTVAGLFLAFPAIFPASATLLEKHQRERKLRKGLHGEQRGIDAAAVDAAGAAMGSTGQIAFAVICWLLIPRYPAGFVLVGAAGMWLLTAVLLWILRKRRRSIRFGTEGRSRAQA